MIGCIESNLFVSFSTKVSSKSKGDMNLLTKQRIKPSGKFYKKQGCKTKIDYCCYCTILQNFELCRVILVKTLIDIHAIHVVQNVRRPHM